MDYNPGSRFGAPWVAAMTGHPLKDVEAVLDAHYLGRDIQLAEAAVLKLENKTVKRRCKRRRFTSLDELLSV